MQDRIKYIISLDKIVNPDSKMDENTKIKGATLKKLCEYAGPGYYRVVKWYEDKVKEHQLKDTPDMLAAHAEFKACFELMKGRNKKYGDSWKVLTVPSIANLCEMKLHRIANMDSKELDPKIEDELQDTANYMIFALIKYRQMHAAK